MQIAKFFFVVALFSFAAFLLFLFGVPIFKMHKSFVGKVILFSILIATPLFHKIFFGLKTVPIEEKISICILYSIILIVFLKILNQWSGITENFTRFSYAPGRAIQGSIRAFILLTLCPGMLAIYIFNKDDHLLLMSETSRMSKSSQILDIGLAM